MKYPIKNNLLFISKLRELWKNVCKQKIARKLRKLFMNNASNCVTGIF